MDIYLVSFIRLDCHYSWSDQHKIQISFHSDKNSLCSPAALAHVVIDLCWLLMFSLYSYPSNTWEFWKGCLGWYQYNLIHLAQKRMLHFSLPAEQSKLFFLIQVQNICGNYPPKERIQSSFLNIEQCLIKSLKKSHSEAIWLGHNMQERAVIGSKNLCQNIYTSGDWSYVISTKSTGSPS